MPKKPTGKKVTSSRGVGEKVKTARGRTTSSVRWLQRQLNDPYVQQAQRDGYRSRAAYKLIDLDEKFKLLKPCMKVVDLGCAPGGWTQVAAQRIGSKGSVVGIDLLPMDAVADATIFEYDFLADDAPEMITNALGGKADIVLSDMAANTTGHGPTDHLRIIHLCEIAYHFATEILVIGGAFVCKVRQGGTEGKLLKEMQKRFTTVKHAKPKSSRADSAESYVVAMGFKG
jgi:23S rRNA (uridine2552-2'-O)-methyltransferase